VIDNDPYREFMGIDDQLNKAIEVILQQIKEEPTRFRHARRDRLDSQNTSTPTLWYIFS
jgi:hypothetical protein